MSVMARRINVKTIVITTSSLKELSSVITVLKYSRIKHKIKISNFNKTAEVYVRIQDDMDLAILKSMNIDIIDNAKAQEISKHCLMVAEEFKKNPLLRAIASYS